MSKLGTAEALAFAGVAPRYQAIDLAKLPPWLPDGYHKVARRLLQLIGNPAVIALCGDVGVGKTALCAGLISRCHAMHRRAYLRNVAVIIRELAEADFNRKDLIRRRYASAPLLIIDDLQERDRRSAGEVELGDLVDARYGGQLPLVLASNLRPEDLQANLGPRIYRRIAESGGIINITGPAIESLRPKVGA